MARCCCSRSLARSVPPLTSALRRARPSACNRFKLGDIFSWPHRLSSRLHTHTRFVDSVACYFCPQVRGDSFQRAIMTNVQAAQKQSHEMRQQLRSDLDKLYSQLLSISDMAPGSQPQQ